MCRSWHDAGTHCQHGLDVVAEQTGKRTKSELRDIDYTQRTLSEDSLCVVQ